ncbi:NAD(P)-dependent oxidoreductase [Nocardia sp. AB354]|uniref:NAD(P)-dependent oxidoreductase n=1 Tax=Nocardia sp. AB354 TaxID=3413283 RepID=UPI003C180008
MRVTVFGANGRTGKHLVGQALAAGHDVTAVVRATAHTLPADSKLTVITANVMEPGEIEPAVAGAGAVLDAIGTREQGPTTVMADAAKSIGQAMEATGARRLIVVSNSAAVAGPGDDPFTRYAVKPLILQRLLRHSLDDMARAEEAVRHTRLDWTIVRAPQLTDKPATGAYRTATDRNVTFGIRITRSDLAACMIDLIDRPETIRPHIHVAG